MPTLNWIGKDAVINHHKEVPFRLLKCRADLSVGDPDSGNLLVQGDNLEALKALLPARWTGKPESDLRQRLPHPNYRFPLSKCTHLGRGQGWGPSPLPPNSHRTIF